jgi:branched-subunit amino acid aminotransferase/4-amino-4-deoxychorismate lyase
LEILKKEPLNITRAVKVRTSGLLPSYLKIGNYVETNLEIKRAKELGFEDIFFLDNRNNILECSTSNIFTIKNNKALTPLDNGLFLNGITRQKIIEMLSANKIFIEETNLNYYDFLQSDEIFICNSVKGIRFIGKIEDKKFENHKISKKICEIFDDFLRKNCE